LDEMAKDGAFKRKDSVYRDFISDDNPRFKPEGMVAHVLRWFNISLEGYLEDLCGYRGDHLVIFQRRPGVHFVSLMQTYGVQSFRVLAMLPTKLQ
jgi:hypothetical protein